MHMSLPSKEVNIFVQMSITVIIEMAVLPCNCLE